MAIVCSPAKDFTPLLSINSTTYDGFYEVRLLRKWFVVDPSNPASFGRFEMVFVDENGHKIQAMVPNSLFPLFDDVFVEGRVYMISNLSIVFNTGSLLPTYHRFKFEFHEYSVVLPSSNRLISKFGFSLIGAENVLKRREEFPYLVDVIGVLTSVVHDKNFFPDGNVTHSVTFKLNNQKKGFYCELSGDYAEEFRTQVQCCSKGLPVIILQFVELAMSQGGRLVKSVEGITKLFVDPIVDEVENFKHGMVKYLTDVIDFSALYRTSRRTYLSRTLDYLKDYPVVCLADLKNNPGLGTFVVNARIIDIVNFHPWWYPLCDCAKIIENYVGDFECTKCHLTEFLPGPKVKINFEVEDDTGVANFIAFDHVMRTVVELKMSSKGLNANFLFKAFGGVLGKSIMFIVRKNSHNPETLDGGFEVVSVSDHISIINYFSENGQCNLSSKEFIRKRNGADAKQKKVVNNVPCTTTTMALIDEYLSVSIQHLVNPDIASSSFSRV